MAAITRRAFLAGAATAAVLGTPVFAQRPRRGRVLLAPGNGSLEA